MEPIIATWGGGSFNFEDPKPEMINIEDIAKSLSCICRYTGHCNNFYSVAQHSILMANLTEFDGMGTPLQRLLHDSAEAYLGDITTPLKSNLYYGEQKIKTLEKRILKVIGKALHVDLSTYLDTIADRIMMATEVEYLMNPKSRAIFNKCLVGVNPLKYVIEPWDWTAAYELFLQSYYELKEREKNDNSEKNGRRESGDRLRVSGEEQSSDGVEEVRDGSNKG